MEGWGNGVGTAVQGVAVGEWPKETGAYAKGSQQRHEWGGETSWWQPAPRQNIFKCALTVAVG